MDQLPLNDKLAALEREIGRFESLLVAFSGGVDSTFLLAVAKRVLGERVTAITALSPVHPEKEGEDAEKIVKSLGIRHIRHHSDEMDDPEFLANTSMRCYHCKKKLFASFLAVAGEIGAEALAHGANLDDLDDFRPGYKAAEELGVVAPMVDVGLKKAEIRQLSKQMGLSTWDKPALACLASRIPAGTVITREKLAMVEGAEEVLAELGFIGTRVRHHDTIARIEVAPEAFGRIIDGAVRSEILERFRELGFRYVSLDLEGYRQGSMNID